MKREKLTDGCLTHLEERGARKRELSTRRRAIREKENYPREVRVVSHCLFQHFLHMHSNSHLSLLFQPGFRQGDAFQISTAPRLDNWTTLRRYLRRACSLIELATYICIEKAWNNTFSSFTSWVSSSPSSLR